MARSTKALTATAVVALAAAALVGTSTSASVAAPTRLDPVSARQPSGGIAPAAAAKSTPNSVAGSTKISRTDLWSVGYADGGATIDPLVLHGNGSAWSRVRAPEPKGSVRDFLFAVSGTATDDVWAVGSWSPDASNYYPTSVHFDGTAWHVVRMPYLSKNNFNSLYAIKAFAPNDVWAAGLQQASDSSERTALIEHWNGTRWSIVDSPDIAGAPFVSLTSMSGTSSTDLWVAGWRQAKTGKVSTLTEHWNGTAWTPVSAPNAPRRSSELYALTAIAPNNVWAAGFAPGDSSADVATLSEHWDGTAWSIVRSPNSTNPTNELFALTANGPNDIWATGNSATDEEFPVASTLTEHWNGQKWTVVASPNASGASSYLATAVAINTTNVWALGVSADTRSGQVPLLAQWNGTTWTTHPVG